MDAGNGKFNLMIVCWGEGHGSAIHDHAGTHCFMKMLQGELREIRYEWPTVVDEADNCEPADIAVLPDANGEYNSDELQEMSRGTMELNSVRYINGNTFFLIFSINKIDCYSLFNKYFLTNNYLQIIWDFIVLKMQAIRMLLYHCIYTVHHTVHARYLIKKLANKPNAM